MYCSGYAYVGTSRGILPTMDMLLRTSSYCGYAPARTSYGDYAPSSYGYGYAPARTSYGGYVPPSYEYDLPTMDTPSARTFYDGYALMDITLVNCGYASIKDWIFYGK